MMDPDSGASPEVLQQMWKMLDDMAENDPAEYQKFITSAKQEMSVQRESEMFTPTPSFVINAVFETVGLRVSESSPGDFFADAYVNICHSNRVLAPFDDSRKLAENVRQLDNCAIPVSVGCRREDCKGLQGTKKRVIYDVVVHDLVSVRSKSDSKFKNFLSMLVFEKVIENESKINPACSHTIRLRKGSVNFPSISYKAGKFPQKHCLQPTADPLLFSKQNIHDNSKTEKKTEIQTRFEEENVTLLTERLLTSPQVTRNSDSSRPLIEVVAETSFDAQDSSSFVHVEGGRDWIESKSFVFDRLTGCLTVDVSLQDGIHVGEDLGIEYAQTGIEIENGGFEPICIRWNDSKLNILQSPSVNFRPKKKLLQVRLTLG